MNNVSSISPAPTDEEAAIIVASIEALWPKPVMLIPGAAAQDPESAWRFSGRWWTRPVVSRRYRPGR
jgi:hypothetical protein